MEYLIGALAVFWILNLAEMGLQAPEWAWKLLSTVLGLGAALLVDVDRWYWGFGIAGLTALLQLLADLALVACDWARVAVLRNTRRG